MCVCFSSSFCFILIISIFQITVLFTLSHLIQCFCLRYNQFLFLGVTWCWLPLQFSCYDNFWLCDGMAILRINQYNTIINENDKLVCVALRYGCIHFENLVFFTSRFFIFILKVRIEIRKCKIVKITLSSVFLFTFIFIVNLISYHFLSFFHNFHQIC